MGQGPGMGPSTFVRTKVKYKYCKTLSVQVQVHVLYTSGNVLKSKNTLEHISLQAQLHV